MPRPEWGYFIAAVVLVIVTPIRRGHMHWNLYLRDNRIYVPTVAKTQAGFYLEIEPVAVIDADNREEIRIAIKRVLTAGNPVMATPTRMNFPK